jgi:DNA-binding response OmpR family regulator
MAIGKRNGDGPAILLAEDDDSFRVFLRISFEHEGFRVLEARDGAEAIERALAHRPAALVLDLLLPRLTGQDVLAALRANREFDGVPIVVVSGTPEVRDAEGLREAGADAAFEKPVPPPDVVAEVARLLREGRAR